ncbi:MAG TPA: DUF2807 domain-containing protein, partial [Polyangiaceae bacterium]|nr:DUF2807 domain-containing protein [Polyangiaceae bacterium]
MQRLVAWFVVALALGCGPRTNGSGGAKTETRRVAAFSEVDAATGIEVRVHVGTAISVAVSGDDNIIPLVETDVSANRLHVGFKSGQSVHPATPVHVDVAVPRRTYLSATSACHVTADGISADVFELHA